MTETQVGFLYKAATSLQKAEGKNINLLRSYYLMCCKDITKGYGLPEKHFSDKARCSRCCLEWTKEIKTKVKTIKLSKKQRQRIRSQKANKNNKELLEKRKELLNSKEIEQICSFCKQSTIMIAKKPDKIKTPVKLINNTTNPAESKNSQNNKPVVTSTAKEIDASKAKKNDDKKNKINKSNEINVYSLSKDIFLLSNKKNILPSAKKEEQKIIKNNKKKKDKFAGLCQKAVKATAKIKEEKDKQNKLNLFLKPSI